MMRAMWKAVAVTVVAFLLSSCYAPDTDEYRPGRQARDLNNKAIRSMSEKNYEQALMQINDAIAAEPEFYSAYGNKSAILLAMGRDADAAAALQAALQVKPDYAEAYVPLGLLDERGGKKAEAKELYLKAVELYDARLRKKPDDVDTAVNRAVAVYLGQDARTALLALKDIITAHPDHKLARLVRQRIEQGNRQEFIAGG
jgi:tetratricopeptide (TPR) repeat protein